MSLPETRLKHPFSMSDVRLKANEEIVYQNTPLSRKGVFEDFLKNLVMWQSLGYGSVASERRSRPLTAESKCIMGYLI